MNWKPALADWLKSGEYLPEFMRDFHDQKDVFKAMHHIYQKTQTKMATRAMGKPRLSITSCGIWPDADTPCSAVEKQVEFRDMEGDIDKMKKDVYSAFSKLVEAHHG